MRLSERMKAIGALVPEGCVLADIGTDHAYLPIELCKKNRIRGAIAMDINAGPLERARRHIVQSGLEDYIETRQSDGFGALKKGEADCALIAGMGGRLTIRILKAGAGVVASLDALILQPQSEIGSVRRYIAECGMVITVEDMVLEDGKFYPMMKAKFGQARSLNDIEYKYGPLLLRGRHPVLIAYLQKEKTELETIRNRLAGDGGARSRARLAEVEKELECIKRTGLII